MTGHVTGFFGHVTGRVDIRSYYSFGVVPWASRMDDGRTTKSARPHALWVDSPHAKAYDGSMNLSQYLEATGQTQGQFARHMGVPQPMLSKWIHLSSPSLRHAIVIAARSGGTIGLAELLRPEDYAALLEALGGKLPATLPVTGSPSPAPSPAPLES